MSEPGDILIYGYYFIYDHPLFEQDGLRSPLLLLRSAFNRRRLEGLRRQLLRRRQGPRAPPRHLPYPRGATSAETGVAVGEEEGAAERAALAPRVGAATALAATDEHGAALAAAVEMGRLSWMLYKTRVGISIRTGLYPCHIKIFFSKCTYKDNFFNTSPRHH